MNRPWTLWTWWTTWTFGRTQPAPGRLGAFALSTRSTPSTVSAGSTQPPVP